MSRLPNMTIITITGSNQNFFRALRYCRNSTSIATKCLLDLLAHHPRIGTMLLSLTQSASELTPRGTCPCLLYPGAICTRRCDSHKAAVSSRLKVALNPNNSSKISNCFPTVIIVLSILVQVFEAR